MRKNIYIALFSVGLLGACNDQLDLNPIGAVSQDSFYTTASDANAAVTACYNALMAYHTGGAHITGMDMWGDIQSSDAEPHPDGVAWNQIYNRKSTRLNSSHVKIQNLINRSNDIYR